MRHALILAGGSGTRLWPMSRRSLPKQLIPFLGGRSLLEASFQRLSGLVPAERCHVCAAEDYRDSILRALPGLTPERFLGEPTGRDTLNAVGYAAAVLGTTDPDAVIGVFTSDHVIEPLEEFRSIVDLGFAVAERDPRALVTFGVTPSGPSTAYGYLQVGDVVENGVRVVERFREKPDLATATGYFEAGPDRYLWNSGMFVWRASTLLECIRRYEPETWDGLRRIAEAWGTPDRSHTLALVYPRLKKVSVDYAVMEPASHDPSVRVVAVPMPLLWLDVGSWTSFARTCPEDQEENALGGGRHVLLRASRNVLASSDPRHLIAVLGCEGLVVIHTPEVTLVCKASDAEAVKELHGKVVERFGDELA